MFLKFTIPRLKSKFDRILCGMWEKKSPWSLRRLPMRHFKVESGLLFCMYEYVEIFSFLVCWTLYVYLYKCTFFMIFNLHSTLNKLNFFNSFLGVQCFFMYKLSLLSLSGTLPWLCFPFLAIFYFCICSVCFCFICRPFSLFWHILSYRFARHDSLFATQVETERYSYYPIINSFKYSYLFILPPFKQNKNATKNLTHRAASATRVASFYGRPVRLENAITFEIPRPLLLVCLLIVLLCCMLLPLLHSCVCVLQPFAFVFAGKSHFLEPATQHAVPPSPSFTAPPGC